MRVHTRWQHVLRAICLLISMVLAVILWSGAGVFASQVGNVYDDAELLTDRERNALNNEITALTEETGWNIYAVTTDDAQGKSAMAYADDFFDEHSPEQEDGVVLLIDMDNREIWLSTCGIAIRYLTDARIDAILDDAYTDVSNGRYGDCLGTMLDGVAKYYDAGIPGGQYNYDEETGAISVYRTIEPFEFVVAILLAIASGVAVYLVVSAKYRMKIGTYQYAYRENSDVRLRVREDRFVNQTTTHRRIPQQTSSGGGSHSSGRSTTHRSSSGRSHGGGGRRF